MLLYRVLHFCTYSLKSQECSWSYQVQLSGENGLIIFMVSYKVIAVNFVRTNKALERAIRTNKALKRAIAVMRLEAFFHLGVISYTSAPTHQLWNYLERSQLWFHTKTLAHFSIFIFQLARKYHSYHGLRRDVYPHLF